MSGKQIRITAGGPYVVSGGVPLDEQVMVDRDDHREYEAGSTFEVGEEYALCRCGHSKNPPFCDGAHNDVSFCGSETASRAPYDRRARIYRGETLDLFDDGRCAFARFCHRRHGSAWSLTEESDIPLLREEAIRAASDCPTGRLVQHDKTDGYREIEPDFKPSISILQDPGRGVSGPLYVKGRIPLIGTDGVPYETRNRYALCRCGVSKEMPFCDAMHVNMGYRDGLEDAKSTGKGRE